MLRSDLVVGFLIRGNSKRPRINWRVAATASHSFVAVAGSSTTSKFIASSAATDFADSPAILVGGAFDSAGSASFRQANAVPAATPLPAVRRKCGCCCFFGGWVADVEVALVFFSAIGGGADFDRSTNFKQTNALRCYGDTSGAAISMLLLNKFLFSMPYSNHPHGKDVRNLSILSAKNRKANPNKSRNSSCMCVVRSV